MAHLLASTLKGAALDAWVARAGDPRAKGLRFEWRGDHYVGVPLEREVDPTTGDVEAEMVVVIICDHNALRCMQLYRQYGIDVSFDYSPQRGEGVRLLDATRIGVNPLDDGRWEAFVLDEQGLPSKHTQGDTIMEAGLRCYVRVNYGETVLDEATLEENRAK